MLEANKNLWFEKLFAVYNRNLLKRRFHSLKVKDFSQIKNRNEKIPLIIYANHSSWWDGLVFFEILKSREFDSFVLMEEKQLAKLKFFRKLGAFSVVRENPREALKTIEYTAGLLKENSNNTLWIFPQGEILPNDRRPVIFYNGFSRTIAKTDGCFVLPLAIRYEFLGEYKPEIFVNIGNAEFIKSDENFNIKKRTKYFAENLTVVLDELKSDILNKNLAEYRKIV